TPLVVQEAKARQLPVAATEVGGIPDLYHGDEGWFPLTPDCDEVVESEICDLLIRLNQNPQAIEDKRRQLRDPAVPILFRRDSSRRLAEILQEVCS
ncbi:MAG: glycosyltransferase, partial [Planctomycetota bacterium]